MTQQQASIVTIQQQHQIQYQQQQEVQQQYPLPVSMTLMPPSSSISHPPQIGVKTHVTAANVMPIDKSVTTVIQSIPSTIVSSREITRNPSQRSLRKGILKAPTPPPRPPPPTPAKPIAARATAGVLIKRSTSQLSNQATKIEKVQSKIFCSSFYNFSCFSFIYPFIEIISLIEIIIFHA